MQTKFCSSCQTVKIATHFHKAKKEKDGLQYCCIACSKQYHAHRYIEQKDKLQKQIQEYRKNNPKRLAIARDTWRSNNMEKVRKYQRVSNLRKKFGLSVAEYDAMAGQQNNLCAICGEPETFIHKASKEIARLAVDHCHITGQIRKLLCKRCNTGLGLFKDNLAILSSVIVYLKEHNGRSKL